MSDSQPASANRAVFLSYASQDAEAARRIADALRSVGVELWFDQNELVGGDAWDAKIRKQIKECALFVPVISAATQARTEGYFRLEWRLADQRTHLMAKGRPFLMPVVVDATRDSDAHVPDSFTEVQWTRLNGDMALAAFATHIAASLSGPAGTAGSSASGPNPSLGTRAQPRRSVTRLLAVITVPVLITVIALIASRPAAPTETTSTSAPPNPAVPVSEARKLALRARKAADELSITAEDLSQKAIALDAFDPEVWAVAASVDARFFFYSVDSSDERRQQAHEKAARAVALDPKNFEARRARAYVLSVAGTSVAMREAALHELRALESERPNSLQNEIAATLERLGRYDEAVEIFRQTGNRGGLMWSLISAGRIEEARPVVNDALGRDPEGKGSFLRYWIESRCDEDLVAAQQTFQKFSSLSSYANVAIEVPLLQRDARAAAVAANAMIPEYSPAHAGGMLKRYYLGIALEMDRNFEGARAQWTSALRFVQERRTKVPNDYEMLGWQGMVEACLGERDSAKRSLAVLRGKTPPEARARNVWPTLLIAARLGLADEVLDELETTRRSAPTVVRFYHYLLRFSPEFDSLRGNPRFEQFLRATLPPGARPFDEPVVPAAKSEAKR
jgi:tetratricopeptide (TPR) repeat protein